MIEGMARAANVFGRPDWLASAARAVDFIQSRMWRNERLQATYKDGRAHLNAYLDDYAFLLKALLELLQAEYRSGWMAFAEDVAEALLEGFEDRAAGGFFFTRHDHERLIHRPRPGFDNATPSGNAVAAFALQRLALLTGETRYRAAAERTLALYWNSIGSAGCCTMLTALDEWLIPPRTVILAGPPAGCEVWRMRLAQRHDPRTMVLAVGRAGELPPPLAKPHGDSVNAWVCEGVTCLMPVTELDKLLVMLDAPAGQSSAGRRDAGGLFD
jgi:hypothetical protein